MFDQATTVAVVQAPPAPRAPRTTRRRRPVAPAGPVALRIETLVKGPAAATVALTFDTSDCDGSVAPGKRALVFVDSHGSLVEGYEGALPATGDWVAVLGRWRDAATAADRAALLVALTVAGGETGLGAGTALAEHPELLAVLTRDQIASLVAVLPRVSSLSLLPLALARVHAPGLDAAIAARDRGPVHRRTLIYGDIARGLATISDYEAITDPAALADAIVHARAPAHVVAAFDRCERVRRARLRSFQGYYGGEPVDELARACRQ
jgi:hypothetical protein